jgi:hypothetical protein
MKKNLNFKKQWNKFCKKPKENICLLPLCDLSKKTIFHSLWKRYRMKLYYFTYFLTLKFPPQI